MPPILAWFRLIGMIDPLNPPANRLCVNTAPTEFGRSLTPITATFFGLNRNSRLRTVMNCPRQLVDRPRTVYLLNLLFVSLH